VSVYRVLRGQLRRLANVRLPAGSACQLLADFVAKSVEADHEPGVRYVDANLGEVDP
jgi:hypothetical protein